MALSPSTLFHFTSKKKGLKGILKDNFKLKYCIEKIDNTKKPVELAIPMVSFCDIKISEIKEHIEKYGSYGIGLSKDWANEKGLNPVFYMNSSSDFSETLISTIRKFITNKEIEEIDRANLTNLLRYTKVYEGDLKRKQKVTKNYRYADEREWRYVPKMRKNDEFRDWLRKEDYDTSVKKDFHNSKLKDERLFFNPNQILYIIVKKEDEITEILNHIKDVKGLNYTLQETERLTTRIISCERIINDF